MKLIIFVIAILVMVWIASYQEEHPTPYGGDPRPSQIINLPEDVAREAGVARQQQASTVSGETTSAAPTAEPIDEPITAAPVTAADDVALEPIPAAAETIESGAEDAAVEAIESQLDMPGFMQEEPATAQ